MKWLKRLLKKYFRKREYFYGMDWGSPGGDYTCRVDGYEKGGKKYITDVKWFDHDGKEVEF